MSDQQMPLDVFFDTWRRETSGISGDDQIRTVITRAFDGLENLSNASNTDLQSYLETMRNERKEAYKSDTKVEKDSLRQYFYGITESVEQAIERFLARENEDVQDPTEEPTNQDTQAQDNISTAKRSKMNHLPKSAGSASDIDPMEVADECERVAATPTPKKIESSAQQFAKAAALSIPKRVRTLTCPKCEWPGMHISEFVIHLRNEHRASPCEMNIGFKCACGFVHYNYIDVRRHTDSCENCVLSTFKIRRDPKKTTTAA